MARGRCELSVLYAYDIELMEPICAELFPRNSIDSISYNAFIRGNDIRKGISMVDKGFPPGKISDESKERPELHFLTLIKRNNRRIGDNDMFSFEGVFEGIEVEGHVVCKKKQIKGKRFLYTYRDARKVTIEETDFFSRVEDQNFFDADKYSQKRASFRSTVFELDQELDAKLPISETMSASFWN